MSKVTRDRIYLYLFLKNYKELKEFYGTSLKVQFDNVTEMLTTSIKSCGGEIIYTDTKSITVDFKNDFDEILELSREIKRTLDYIDELTREYDLKFEFVACVLEGSEFSKNPFKKPKLFTDKTDTPFLLISEKVYKRLLDSYSLSETGLDKIWTTKGIKVSESERVNNVYVHLEKEEEIEKFLASSDSLNKLLIYGESGTGKSSLVNQTFKKLNGDWDIIAYEAKKSYDSDYGIILQLAKKLLPGFESDTHYSVDETLEIISQSNLKDINKENLIEFVDLLFGKKPCEGSCANYNDIHLRMKLFFSDILELYLKDADKKVLIFIDDFDDLSDNSKSILTECSQNIDIKFIFASIEKPEDCTYFKTLGIKPFNLKQTTQFLKECFPGRIVTKKFISDIHKITTGNPYILKEYIAYMLSNNLVNRNDRYVKAGGYDTNVSGLDDLYEKKIEKLDDNQRDLLKILSVFGNEAYFVDFDTLLHVINYPHDVDDGLEQLVNQGLISIGDKKYRFTEKSLSKELYKKISKPNRKVLHELLAAFYERKNRTENCFNVFIHYYQAEKYDRLFKLLPDLLKEAYGRLDFIALSNMLRLTQDLIKSLDKKADDKKEAKEKKKAEEAKKLDNENGDDKEKEETKHKDKPSHEDKEADKRKDLLYLVNYYKLLTSKNLSSMVAYEEVLKDLETDEKYDKYLEFSYIYAEKLYKEKKFRKLASVLRKSTQLAEDKKNNRALADFLTLDSYYEINYKKTENFRKNLKKAITLYETYGFSKFDIDLVAESLGDYYFSRNEYAKAIKAFSILAERYFRQFRVDKMIKAKEMLSRCYLLNKNYDEALESYKKLLEYYTTFGLSDKTGFAELYIAKIHSFTNRHHIAIDMLNDIIDRYQDNLRLLYSCYFSLGQIYMHVQEYDNCEISLYNAQESAGLLRNPDLEFTVLIRLGFLQLERQNYDEAQTLFKHAKKIKRAPKLMAIGDLCLQVSNLGDLRNLDEDFNLIIDKLQKSEIIEKFIKFEIFTALVKVLYTKNHFIKVKELLPIVNELMEFTFDSNMIEEVREIERSITKSNRRIKTISDARQKIHPVVKRRFVRRRRR